MCRFFGGVFVISCKQNVISPVPNTKKNVTCTTCSYPRPTTYDRIWNRHNDKKESYGNLNLNICWKYDEKLAKTWQEIIKKFGLFESGCIFCVIFNRASQIRYQQRFWRNTQEIVFLTCFFAKSLLVFTSPKKWEVTFLALVVRQTVFASRPRQKIFWKSYNVGVKYFCDNLLKTDKKERFTHIIQCKRTFLFASSESSRETFLAMLCFSTYHCSWVIAKKNAEQDYVSALAILEGFGMPVVEACLTLSFLY